MSIQLFQGLIQELVLRLQQNSLNRMFFQITIADMLTVISIAAAAAYYIMDRRRARKVATMSAYSELQNSVFRELNRWSPSEIRSAASNNQSDVYKTLGEHLAKIEFFCVGINQKIYDFDVFYSISHGYFDKGGTLYYRLIPLLERKLEIAGQDHFQNIHIVWKKMDSRSRRRL